MFKFGQKVRPPRPTPQNVYVRQKGLRGDLEEFGLPAVLTLLQLEEKTGELTIRRAKEKTTLLLRAGRIIHASALGEEESDGAGAIYRVLSWPDGRFRFVSRSVDSEDKIRESTTRLLMEGARRMDESRRA